MKPARSAAVSGGREGRAGEGTQGADERILGIAGAVVRVEGGRGKAGAARKRHRHILRGGGPPSGSEAEQALHDVVAVHEPEPELDDRARWIGAAGAVLDLARRGPRSGCARGLPCGGARSP